MRVAIGCDHRGFQVKHRLMQWLQQSDHDVNEILLDGQSEGVIVDYPDVATIVAGLVSEGKADRGILIDGTGIGVCVAANKFKNVRAAVCYDEVTAEMSRRHNDVNVLCLSGDLLGERSVDRLLEIWLGTEFEGGRHERRIAKINDLEKCGE